LNVDDVSWRCGVVVGIAPSRDGTFLVTKEDIRKKLNKKVLGGADRFLKSIVIIDSHLT
jgi:hypothetical protein